jgi:hypothetical protein
VCRDGDACDFDSIAGQCTFRIGACLNRLGIAGCAVGDLRSLDVPVHVDVVDVFRTPGAVPAIAREALQIEAGFAVPATVEPAKTPSQPDKAQ